MLEGSPYARRIMSSGSICIEKYASRIQDTETYWWVTKPKHNLFFEDWEMVV